MRQPEPASCLITDHWAGIEEFFNPGCEILVARNAQDIADLLRTVDAKLAREIGEAMRERARQEHTYALRALQVREILSQSSPEVLSRAQSRFATAVGMKIVVFGLSVTSTWGNGHGTTFRALLRALHRRGHDVRFF